MIYFIILFYILVCCYIFDYRQRVNGRLVCWILLMLTLIGIAGFRYRMGGDTIGYMKFFDTLPAIDELKPIHYQKSRFAPGFVFLTSLAKSIYPDFMVLQLIVSGFLNCVVFYFIWKNTRHIFFVSLFYCCFMFMNLNMEVMREAIAVGIFLLAWPFFRDRKWLPYYCIVLCAVLFHVSAVFLLVLPVITVPGIRNLFVYGKKVWIVSLIVLVIGLLIGTFFFSYIKFLALAENITERAEVYSKNDIGGKSGLNLGGMIMIFIKYVIYPMLAMYCLSFCKKKGLLKIGGIEKIESIAIASIYISILSISIFIMGRYNNYLLLFSYIVIADWVFSYIIIKGMPVKLRFPTWIIIFIPLFVTSWFTFYNNRINTDGTLRVYMQYYPYKDGFSKELDPNREKVIEYAKKY